MITLLRPLAYAFGPVPSTQVVLQRKCACGRHTGAGGECESCKSDKLHRSVSVEHRPMPLPSSAISRPDDPSEREADRIAEAVMSGSMPSFAPAPEPAPLQRATTAARVSGVPPIVNDVLASPGQPLDAATRAFFEPRFSQNLGHVRVHTGDKAAASAHAVEAAAYTVRNHVVLGHGGIHSGKQNVLAHELAHVVQQGAARLFRRPISKCSTLYSKANNFKDLIDLVRAAETKLSAAGITSTADRIKSIRGIYYGPEWSMDFKAEKSKTRNLGFEAFTGSLLSPPSDPTTILDCGLFGALQASSDVKDPRGQVDFGHLIIGLDARNSLVPSFSFPGFGGTGTEIVTWLGDLGGGAGALALARGRTPTTSAARVFRGSDYGGSINLEGDIAAYVVGRGGATSPVAPVFSTGKGIADLLQDYLSSKTGSEWKDRATTFLTMNGGTFDKTGGLTNRAALISTFAAKVKTFACQYLATRLIDGRTAALHVNAATDHVIPASQEVAEAFVDALDDCHKIGARLEAKRFPTPKPSVPGACSALTLTIATKKRTDEARKRAGQEADRLIRELGDW